jgi:hypothetical protein
VAISAFAAYEQHKPKAWTGYQHLAPREELQALRRLSELEARAALMPTPADIRRQYPGAYDDMSDQQLADALNRKFSQRWDAARIGAVLSAVLTNGVLPAALGYAGLFLLMWVTRWIVAGFKGT